ncbi:hypothetical protein OSB04_026146 [Centaurea solstitialis]|uniref:Kinesin motor domain-containing protein n=1 Tax=Centaurea solstitialis TaxID=347529 RepID=A0AA38SBD4_9ASTR|nr:hypothetical protein OSB04_026146 [Centaurea solstitialis]
MDSRSSHTASVTPSSRNQTKSCSKLGGKVRIVARIRGFKDLELASEPVIHVCKSGDNGALEKVTLSFDDQTSSRKNEYEVDCCYHQNEDTALIFSREVKPRIAKVFDGESSTFIAFGARGSGKTFTIQGSKENSGLGMLVVDEILKMVEGGKHAVAVSFYEVFQDHVYDLLDPKNPEVPVKSILEFEKLYYIGSNSNKPKQKVALELPRRSHKALMIHILACDERQNPKCVGKMNFVDLAGYENAKRNSIDGANLVEGTLINKSLNALFNVIHAVSANESRVPYRESKITRVLQDSLGGNNHISMFVCLNPLFCPDTIHAVTLASRLKSIKPVAAKKQSNSSAPLSANKADSVVASRSAAKKGPNSRLPSGKKTNEYFGDTNTKQASGFKKKANNPSKVVKSDIPKQKSTVVVPYVEEGKGSLDGALFNSDEVDIASDIVPCSNDKEIVVSDATQENSHASNEEDALVKVEDNCKEVTPPVDGDNIVKEDNTLLVNETKSPPLSVRLKELSMNLQSLCATPLPISMPPVANTEIANIVDTMEPKTPMVTNKMDFSNCPSGKFSKRSSGMKQSFVQEYLEFLNTATKEDLKGIKGIGEKRASYILELREESPQPFKDLDDLQEIGLSAKQVKRMVQNAAGGLFN